MFDGESLTAYRALRETTAQRASTGFRPAAEAAIDQNPQNASGRPPETALRQAGPQGIINPISAEIKAVIFDVDGLMIDSEPTHSEAFAAVIREY